MTNKKSVLVIGLEPTLIDFSDPEFAAFPGINAAKVLAGLNDAKAELTGLGYDAQLCLTDLGETAETVVQERLQRQKFDCVLIGAGIRTITRHFLLFEKLVNVAHAHAPQAKLCFNTKPTDTAEAARRWLR
jgi:hypothetical protein